MLSLKKIISDLSIVIPTIGEDTLIDTINSIIANDCLPHEIVVCIPPKYITASLRNSLLTYPFVKILETKSLGQVTQRIEGFNYVSTALVLQLDCDVFLESGSIESLYTSIKSCGDESSVGATLISLNSDINITDRAYFANFFSLVRRFILNGTYINTPGKIWLCGTAERIFYKDVFQKIAKVDWLQGGCVVHWRKNIIRESYFPFGGKAYCEDLLHSIELTKKNISLWVDTSVVLKTPIASYTSYSFTDFIRYLAHDLRARKLVIQRLNLSYTRMIIFYILILLNYFINIRRFQG